MESVFIVCFSYSCCTDLVCSVLEVELRPYCGLFSRDALGCIYGGNCGGFVGSPCSSACLPQSLLSSLSMTRTCWEAPAVPLSLVKSAFSELCACLLVKSAADNRCLHSLLLFCLWCSVDLCFLFVYSILINFSLVDSILYCICG